MNKFLNLRKIFFAVAFQSLLSQSMASEAIFICEKVNIINPKGSIENVYDRFALNIGTEKNLLGAYKSVVLYGGNQYPVDVRVGIYDYIGIGGYIEKGLHVSSLIIRRSDGSSWLILADDEKGYSFIIYAKCKIRAL